jgi:hypothetical protein
MTRRAEPRTRLSVQPLEAREVPATLVSPTTVTYTDVDGDAVKITFSKPILTEANVNGILTLLPFGVGAGTDVWQQFRSINLAGVNVDRLSITITATKSPTNGGDGLANLGEIVTPRDLNVVRIDGDLGRIVCGDNVPTFRALNSLTAQSMGQFGTTTGAADLESKFGGNVVSIAVAGDVKDAYLNVGNLLTRIKIGGSLIGGATSNAGTVEGDAIENVFVGGDVRGGDGPSSGRIFGRSSGVGVMNSVFVGGSVVGGNGNQSGRIDHADSMGTVKIVGSVLGGAGDSSGEIFSNNKMKSLKIGGDLQGGAGDSSGRIEVIETAGTVRVGGGITGGQGDGSGLIAVRNAASIAVGGSLTGGLGDDSGALDVVDVKSIKIGGDITGGPGESGSGSIHGFNLGQITVGGSIVGSDATGAETRVRGGYIGAKHIGNLVIGDSLRAGMNATTGIFALNGAVRASDDIVAMTVGLIVGNVGNPAYVIARGQANPAGSTDVAIGRLTVLNDLAYAEILAGYTLGWNGTRVASNADAQIGAVTVGRDWIASSVVAGVVSGNGYYGDGDANEGKIVGDKDVAGVSSRIGRVTIGREPAATPNAGDTYGIMAETVGAVKVAGKATALTAGAGNDSTAVTGADDLKVKEV